MVVEDLSGSVEVSPGRFIHKVAIAFLAEHILVRARLLMDAEGKYLGAGIDLDMAKAEQAAIDAIRAVTA